MKELCFLSPPFLTLRTSSRQGSSILDLTLLSFYSTEEDFADFVKNNYFPRASNETIARILELYPADPAAGSHFGTGDQFAFKPVYKRLSAFQGDLIFHGPRRFMLEQLSGKQVARSYCEQSPFSFLS